MKKLEADGDITETKRDINQGTSKVIARSFDLTKQEASLYTNSNSDLFFVENSLLNNYYQSKLPLFWLNFAYFSYRIGRFFAFICENAYGWVNERKYCYFYGDICLFVYSILLLYNPNLLLC